MKRHVFPTFCFTSPSSWQCYAASLIFYTGIFLVYETEWTLQPSLGPELKPVLGEQPGWMARVSVWWGPGQMKMPKQSLDPRKLTEQI